MRKGRKISYKEGYRGQLIKAVLENGFIPRDYIKLYDKPAAIQMQRAVRKMIQEDILKESKTISGSRYLRLTKTGEDLILSEANAELASQYKSPETKIKLRCLNIKKQPKSNQENEIAYKLAQNKLINDVSAKLFAEICGIENKSKEKNICPDSNKAMYYDSTNIKRLGSYEASFTTDKNSQSKKLNNSRINGLTISRGGIYSIYSTGNIMPEWKRKGEERMISSIKALVIRNINDMHVTDYESEAVIISKVDSTYTRIVKEENTKGINKRMLMSVDYAYEHMYSVPYTVDGIKIFTMMQKAGWQAKIKSQMLSHNEMTESMYVSVPCDGYDKKEGIYKLVYCIPDMVKLKGFAKRAAIEEDRERYHIYCYKSQLPIIAPVIQGNAKVFVISIDDMIRELESSEKDSLSFAREVV